MPYAQAIAAITARIERATPAQLVVLGRACQKPDHANCWWAAYRAAQFIAPLIAAERAHRRRSKPKA